MDTGSDYHAAKGTRNIFSYLFGATTFSILTLSVLALSIMTLSIKGLFAARSINDIKHK